MYWAKHSLFLLFAVQEMKLMEVTASTWIIQESHLLSFSKPIHPLISAYQIKLNSLMTPVL